MADAQNVFKHGKRPKSIDWSQCIFCQSKSYEVLTSPTTLKSNNKIGYISLAEDLKKFDDIKCLPMQVDISLLDDGEGMEETLIKHKAKWHKLCRNKFSKLKLKRIEKRLHSSGQSTECDTTTPSKVTRTSSGNVAKYEKDQCFFCNTKSDQLHQVSTFEMDKTVREYANLIQDTVLLAKLSSGDLISQEAKYHLKCYRELYHKARASDAAVEQGQNDSQVHGIVLAELIAYIEESRSEDDDIHVFKLSDLAQLYFDRLNQLGVHLTTPVNVTHLKDRILSNIPDLEAHKHGREINLIFNVDFGKLLQKAKNFDDEAVILSRAASIVRQDVFDQDADVFDGTFNEHCQDRSVPQSLKSLVGMILGGPNIKYQSGKFVEAQAMLTIAQLIKFNIAASRRKNSSTVYHLKQYETPLPTYIGMLIHVQTRKRGLIEKLNQMGLSVSYNRVTELSTQLGNSVSTRYNELDTVCPSSLRHGVFTTGAVDNIDHNPTSTTAQGSFHGTGISVFQHPRNNSVGMKQDTDLVFPNTSTKVLGQLPENYRCVPPASVISNDVEIPAIESSLAIDFQLIPQAIQSQFMWLEHVRESLDSESDDLDLTWAAYHSSQLETQGRENPVDISALLPLFEDQAKSVAMIKHSMTIVRKTTDFLNPGQTPVIACDQPLYAIAKQIQWTWPDRYGEHCFVVMFGGLHIEIAGLKALGNWLQDSGWTHALEQANVATAGTADSFLKASHVGKTFYAHQVTACVLYSLMYRAFLARDEPEFCNSTFENWRSQMESVSPTFLFWSITLRFEITVMLFVKALREGDFTLYKEALVSLVPWFFALDHPNYARWLPVHIRDMIVLEQRNPDVSHQFAQGKFVVHKTQRSFSAIALDHAHEQNNKLIKGDGGAVGLTENASQLLRWMLSGPEVARVVHEFQSSINLLKHEQSKGPDIRHHERQSFAQKRFKTHVLALSNTIEDMGNPFHDHSGDLLVLDSRNIVDASVIETVKNIEQAGKDQYNTFVAERLERKEKLLRCTIKQNKFPLFSRQTPKQISKERQQIGYLKQDCSLFSKLYVSCQVRDGNLEEFFAHENYTFPPSLSQFGNLRLGTKSDLVHCLERHSQVTFEHPLVNALVIDGAVVVNMLKPTGCQTFQEYSNNVFNPYISRQLSTVQRLDVVWDVYYPDSLKSTTRLHRGKGVRRRVLPDTKIPGNWDSFLRVDENKTELFHYLTDEIVNVDHKDKLVVATRDQYIFSSPQYDFRNLAPCSHEEADVKMMVHVADISYQGLKKIMLRTVDTDVLVLAIAIYPQIAVDELWIAFGAGKNLRYIAVHSIVQSLGESKAKALPVFHALTGCDQTSAFCSRGKKTAWETWKSFDAATTSFLALSSSPSLDSVLQEMPTIERFVVLMYDRTCTATEVNDARKYLFTQKGRSIESIPPSSAALLEHTKRAVFQAGYIWGQALKLWPDVPSPAEWGWVRENSKWEPFWSSLSQAAVSCQELLKCGCNPEKGCHGRCKCVKAEMLCTALCRCGGNCDRD